MFPICKVTPFKIWHISSVTIFLEIRSTLSTQLVLDYSMIFPSVFDIYQLALYFCNFVIAHFVKCKPILWFTKLIIHLTWATNELLSFATIALSTGFFALLQIHIGIRFHLWLTVSFVFFFSLVFTENIFDNHIYITLSSSFDMAVLYSVTRKFIILIFLYAASFAQTFGLGCTIMFTSFTSCICYFFRSLWILLPLSLLTSIFIILLPLLGVF